MENNREILCIPGEDHNYAVEFTFIKEICSDVLVSKVPCLPEHFAGVFHYRGSIVPVIRLEHEKGIQDHEKRVVILVLEYQKYQLGILLTKEPYMLETEELTMIEMPEQEEELISDIWIGKAFYQLRDALFSLGDIEKMMNHLVLYHTI